jgi:hypothetical protein
MAFTIFSSCTAELSLGPVVSRYGATVYGQPSRVAMEGARMVKSQVQPDDPNRNGTDNINFTICNADPLRKLTEESQTSRFYGVGRVMPPGSSGAQGMYDMQASPPYHGLRLKTSYSVLTAIYHISEFTTWSIECGNQTEAVISLRTPGS